MIRNQLRELQARLALDKPTPLATLGRVLFIGFMLFTWLSGLVYVVWPLVQQVARHVQVHIIDEVNRWIWAEPVYGGMFANVVNLTMLVMLVYLLRYWILLAVLLAGDKVAALVRLARRKPVRKGGPLPPTHPNCRSSIVPREANTDTAVVAG